MIKATVIRPIGKSSGVMIPKVMLANMGVREGDTLLAVELEDGILLTARDSATRKRWDGSFSRWNEALQECDEGTREQVMVAQGLEPRTSGM